LAPFPLVTEGCQGFVEPNLSTLLYKSKTSLNKGENLKYGTKIRENIDMDIN